MIYGTDQVVNCLHPGHTIGGKLEPRFFEPQKVVLCTEMKTFPLMVYFLQFLCFWGGFGFGGEIVNHCVEYGICRGLIVLHFGGVTVRPKSLDGAVKRTSLNTEFWLRLPFDVNQTTGPRG
jgi:hypothetical protein